MIISEGGDGVKQFAFQEDDYNCHCKYLVDMFYTILEELGLYGSKHDEHRVQITCKCEDKDYD